MYECFSVRQAKPIIACWLDQDQTCKTWKTLKWFRFSARYEQSVPDGQSLFTVLALRWKWTGTQSEIAFSQHGVEHVISRLGEE